MVKLKELIEKAKNHAIKGTEEDWNIIDYELLPEVIKYDHSEVADYVLYLLDDENGDVRDLAGTITAKLEKDSLPYEKREAIRLKLKKRIDDEYPYARFRATVAIIKHEMYDSDDIEKMKKTLEEMEKDENPDVRIIATESLKKLESRKK